MGKWNERQPAYQFPYQNKRVNLGEEPQIKELFLDLADDCPVDKECIFDQRTLTENWVNR